MGSHCSDFSCCTIKGFSIDNEAEVDVFQELPFQFHCFCCFLLLLGWSPNSHYDLLHDLIWAVSATLYFPLCSWLCLPQDLCTSCSLRLLLLQFTCMYPSSPSTLQLHITSSEGLLITKLSNTQPTLVILKPCPKPGMFPVQHILRSPDC